MSSQVAKLTISLPKSLISFADEVASERKISRSKVVSSCLQEFAERRKLALMEEGYKEMAEEQRQFAVMASALAHEVVPKWE